MLSILQYNGTLLMVKFQSLRMGKNMQFPVFLLVIYSVRHVRPHNADSSDCPKFDLNEQLLGRLVRLEHSSGMMIESFREISAQVNNDVGPIKTEYEEIKRQTGEDKHNLDILQAGFEKIKNDAMKQGQKMNDQLELMDQQITEQVHTMETEFEQLKQNVSELGNYLEEALGQGKVRIQEGEETFEALLQKELVKAKTLFNDEVESFRKFVSENKDVTNKPVYVFSLARISNTSPPASEPLVFVDVLKDDWNLYDVSSGKFTAPVDGTFEFFFSMCVATGKDMSFKIVVNGEAVGGGTGYSKTTPESVSSDAIVSLSSGDEVWVEAESTISNGLYDNGGRLCWNQFSGHIIQQ